MDIQGLSGVPASPKKYASYSGGGWGEGGGLGVSPIQARRTRFVQNNLRRKVLAYDYRAILRTSNQFLRYTVLLRNNNSLTEGKRKK